MSRKLLAQAAELEVLAQVLEGATQDAGKPLEAFAEEPTVPALTPVQQRLHDHFGRRATTAWTAKEKASYARATKGKTKEQFVSEMEEVLADQATRGEYHTRSLETLLNQWERKLDEAKQNSDAARREAPRRPML